MLTPGHEAGVRAALVTDLLGRSGSDIAALQNDEQGWELCLEQFREYHHCWHDKGFMVMSRAVMEQEGVRGRLLRYSDGERRLTNLLHCFEVVHGKAHESGVGMEGLAAWFSERVSAKEKSEEHEIRLETDEKAVKILTIHVSKGLEYPIVFSPYLWTGLMGNDDVATFHQGTAMVKDYGSEEFALHQEWGEKEQLAESLRLLYVAVTRARYRCYLYGGKVVSSSVKSRPESSPLAYLFHASPETRQGEELVARLAKEYSVLSAETIQEQLQALAAASDGAISVERLPEEFTPAGRQPDGEQGRRFNCRKFRGTLRNDWRVASFTFFVAHEQNATELPDRDEAPRANEKTRQTVDELPEGMTVFTFPRGTGAGIFMHALFEELEFSSASETAIATVVGKNLELHGFDPAWNPCICAMVADVISTPLETDDGGSFTLSELKGGSWLPELEFFFPLQFITSERLHRSLKGFTGEYQAVDLDAVLSSLRFKPVRGMVRGFMDLVFEQGGRYYLVDWKSNHLGYHPEDYNQEVIRREMVQSRYPLQYLLYTVALNRYLSLRVKSYDYERHFGGVIYLFLRGVTPASRNGICQGQAPCRPGEYSYRATD